MNLTTELLEIMKFQAWLRALGLNFILDESKLRAQSLKVEAWAFQAFEQLVHLWNFTDLWVFMRYKFSDSGDRNCLGVLSNKSVAKTKVTKVSELSKQSEVSKEFQVYPDI